MSKSKKRRNKPYTGADATPSRPVIHRFSAVQRTPLQEWWHEKQRAVKVGTGVAIVVVFFGWILSEAVRIIF